MRRRADLWGVGLWRALATVARAVAADVRGQVARWRGLCGQVGQVAGGVWLGEAAEGQGRWVLGGFYVLRCWKGEGRGLGRGEWGVRGLPSRVDNPRREGAEVPKW